MASHRNAVLEPVQNTWHKVKPAPSPALEDVIEDERRVYVESLDEFMKFYVGLFPSGLCDTISLQVFCVEESDRPGGSCRPALVPVLRVAGFKEPLRFFPRRKSVRRAHDHDAEPPAEGAEGDADDDAGDRAEDEDKEDEALAEDDRVQS